jgi:putative peptide-modifying radical SAM enzyme
MMFFHIILTTECNLKCRYCFGEAVEDSYADFPSFKVDYSLTSKINYDVALLDKFCRKDQDCVLIFYGGEPLLCVEEIKRIMDNVWAKHFIIQTNGLLLNRLEPEYINRFHTIFVSVDGDETLTDYYRGKGTFRWVINNLKLIRQNEFTGEIVARMTVMEHTDIYKQVRWLVENEEFPFSSVHWQLNAGFWNDFEKRNFKEWSEESYNPGVSKLVDYWVSRMEQEGVVLRLYPFLGIANSFLFNERKSILRCGAGWVNYAIQTDGYIVPCPSMWGMKDYYLGHIRNANPLKLRKVSVGEPCTNCDIFGLCGGRCLYANVTRRWCYEAYRYVCKSVGNLISCIRREIPRIGLLLEKEKYV